MDIFPENRKQPVNFLQLSCKVATAAPEHCSRGSVRLLQGSWRKFTDASVKFPHSQSDLLSARRSAASPAPISQTLYKNITPNTRRYAKKQLPLHLEEYKTSRAESDRDTHQIIQKDREGIHC